MARYEVWDRSKLGQRQGQAERVHYTLDSGMNSAKELSKGSTKKQVWDQKAKDPASASWGGGGMVDIEIPNSFAVVERGDKQSVVRGYGIGGKWKDATDCKRCNNSGEETGAWGMPCNSCQGASFKPKI